VNAAGFEPVDAEEQLATEEWQAGYWRGAQIGVWVGALIGGAAVAALITLGRALAS
jgi:hypothetical protein